MADSPNGDPSNLMLKPDGRIICKRCNSRWCNDIAVAISKMTDAVLIWKDDLPDDMNLEIPVFPTNLFYEKVKLGRTVNMRRFEAVWIYKIDPVEYRNLGYINPGESRMTIRSLLVEQMWSDWTPPGYECRASHHGPAAEAVWQRETDEANRNRHVNLWSVYRTSQCIYCATHDPSQDPSLVPDRERSGVWNPVSGR